MTDYLKADVNKMQRTAPYVCSCERGTVALYQDILWWDVEMKRYGCVQTVHAYAKKCNGNLMHKNMK